MIARSHLSALSWTPDPPAGNRLRWSYPIAAGAGDGSRLGLPERLIVERAPLEHVDFDKRNGTMAVPYNWWDDRGDVDLTGFSPLEFDLGSPVQALRFLFRAPSPARLVALDSDTGRAFADRTVSDGDLVHITGDAIDQLLVIGFISARLENLHTLDLFADHGLHWHPIAEIHVRDTLGATLADVAPRYPAGSTVDDPKFDDLRTIAADAHAGAPPPDPNGPDAEQALALALSVRWEHAVLMGFGYVDGSIAAAYPLDDIDVAGVLKGPSAEAYAYRVRDRGDPARTSNAAVCNGIAPALATPSPPTPAGGRVRLTGEGTFEAAFELDWTVSEPLALGVEIEEQMGASAAIASPPERSRYICRTRRSSDPANGGHVARQFTVPFHDVTVGARSRAVDGWDRISGWSMGAGPISLALDHHPPAPAAHSATRSGDSATIRRQTDAAEPWSPDTIVAHAAGRVTVCRRLNVPTTQAISLSDPMPLGVDRYRATVQGGVAPAANFAGGQLIAGSFRSPVDVSIWPELHFDAPSPGAGTVPLFAAGPAMLVQDASHPSLWGDVADLPAAGLPEELTFFDPLPPLGGGADVVTYALQLRFLGRRGPLGAPIQALRIVATPPIPPPFTVALLGVDFYNRTLVQITLTNPAPAERFTVWCADGRAPSGAPDPFAWRIGTSFRDHAVSGEHPAQEPAEGRFLFDVLPLPIPFGAPRPVTFGLQRVRDGGARSDFVTREELLTPAP